MHSLRILIAPYPDQHSIFQDIYFCQFGGYKIVFHCGLIFILLKFNIVRYILFVLAICSLFSEVYLYVFKFIFLLSCLPFLSDFYSKILYICELTLFFSYRCTNFILPIGGFFFVFIWNQQKFLLLLINRS